VILLEILKKLHIDLSEKHNPPVVYAVQGERNSRKISFDLFQNGMAYEIDKTSSVLISYKKPDGHGGMYDVLDNLQPAFEFAEDSTNSVIITLAEQVLTTVGLVPLVVSFVVGDKTLSTFDIVLDVSQNPGIDVAESNDYFILSVAVSAAIAASKELAQENIFPLWVTVEANGDGTYTADTSFASIYSAHKQNRIVVCKYGDVIHTLISINESYCAFSMINMASSTSGTYSRIMILANNTVKLSAIPMNVSGGGGGNLQIIDDGNGNVVITATGSISITDDGEGNVTIE
jgi:hypothetical protein